MSNIEKPAFSKLKKLFGDNETELSHQLQMLEDILGIFHVKDLTFVKLRLIEAFRQAETGNSRSGVYGCGYDDGLRLIGKILHGAI